MASVSQGNMARVAAVLAASLVLFGCNESDRIGELREAKVRKVCFGEVDSAHDSLQGLPRGGREIKYPEILRGLTMLSALNCYVVSNKQAVCEKNNRAYIVDYIGRYFRLKDEMYAAAERVGEAERKIADDVWSDPRDQAILAALEDHIEHGRLNRDDFGWSTPDQIAELLKRHDGVADSCAVEAEWQPPTQPANHFKTFNEVRNEVRNSPGRIAR